MINKLSLIISDIQKEINNPTINCGGCVHFAYFLSEKLKRFGYKHNIVAINTFSYFIDFEEEKEYLLNYQGGCSHLVIHIPKIGYVDAEVTVKNVKSLYRKDISFHVFMLPESFDLNKLRHKDLWNDSYNRQYNKELNKIISKHFKKLKYERKN